MCAWFGTAPAAARDRKPRRPAALLRSELSVQVALPLFAPGLDLVLLLCRSSLDDRLGNISASVALSDPGRGKDRRFPKAFVFGACLKAFRSSAVEPRRRRANMAGQELETVKAATFRS